MGALLLRLEILLSDYNGAQILSDVYNSNPTAAKEVLQAFATVKTTGKRIVVLGDMLELGADAAKMHASVAAEIDPNMIDMVYLCGPLMENLATALADKFSLDKVRSYRPEEKDALAADLLKELGPDDVVLLKASHGIHLEEVLAKIAKNA